MEESVFRSIICRLNGRPFGFMPRAFVEVNNCVSAPYAKPSCYVSPNVGKRNRRRMGNSPIWIDIVEMALGNISPVMKVYSFISLATQPASIAGCCSYLPNVKMVALKLLTHDNNDRARWPVRLFVLHEARHIASGPSDRLAVPAARQSAKGKRRRNAIFMYLNW